MVCEDDDASARRDGMRGSAENARGERHTGGGDLRNARVKSMMGAYDVLSPEAGRWRGDV